MPPENKVSKAASSVVERFITRLKQSRRTRLAGQDDQPAAKILDTKALWSGHSTSSSGSQLKGHFHQCVMVNRGDWLWKLPVVVEIRCSQAQSE
ncbi:hypothetical protein N7454_002810 [Penicillium verhagenii]|nr:hypothetical protein N7454_002810 [Penicillium verhagenii]